jgi:hypothetical protein
MELLMRDPGVVRDRHEREEIAELEHGLNATVKRR